MNEPVPQQHFLSPRFNWLIAVGVCLILVVTLLQRHLLSLQFGLLGDLQETTLYLWHTWWPMYSRGLPETPTISAYASAPYLQNHLLYAPLLQSFVFSLINWIPAQPILAFNLTLILVIIATFLSIYLLARQWNISPVLAIGIAGLFCTSTWYANAVRSSDLILASSFGLPLILYMFDRWQRSQTYWNAAFVGLAAVGTLLTGMQQLAAIVGIFLPYALILYVMEIRTDSERDKEEQQLQIGLMLFLFAFVLLMHPMPNIVRSTQGFEAIFSRPNLFPVESVSLPVAILETTLLPVITAGVALLMAGTNRRHLLVGILGLIALLIGLRIAPEPLVVLSALIGVDYLPIYSPEVFLGPAILMLSLYAGLVFTQQLQNTHTLTVVLTTGAVIVVGIAISQILGEDIQTQRVVQADEVDFLHLMDSQPEDYLTLHYPSQLQADEGAAIASVYGVFHQKRLIYGSIPYPEPQLIDAYENMPFLEVDAESSQVEATVAALTDATNTWRIGYIIVHTEHLSNEQLRDIDALIQATNQLCSAEDIGSLVVYKAFWHPSEC